MIMQQKKLDKLLHKTAEQWKSTANNINEDQHDDKETDAEIIRYNYIATPRLVAVDKTTDVMLEIPYDDVVFLLKPTYWVRFRVESMKYFMHRATRTVHIRAGLNLVNESYLWMQWKNSAIEDARAPKKDETIVIYSCRDPTDRPKGMLIGL